MDAPNAPALSMGAFPKKYNAVKLGQLPKAPSLMRFTLLPKVTEDKLVHPVNALTGISRTLLGTVKERKLLQFLKAALKFINPSGLVKLTYCKLV